MFLGLSAVLSSPSRRCLDTVGGIAAAHDLTVLIRQELAIGDSRIARDLVATLLADEVDALVCTHGENLARFDATCVRSMVPIEGSVGDDSTTEDDIARGVRR